MRSALLGTSLVVVCAACGGASTTPDSATESLVEPIESDVSGPQAETSPATRTVAGDATWLEGIGEGSALPVFEWESRRWVQLDNAVFFEHADIPADWLADRDTRDMNVPRTAPAPHATAIEGVALVTTDGVCTPELGPPTWVDRSGCVAEAAVAQEILGCEGDIAPLAWVARAPTDDVRWVPVDFVEPWAWLDNDAEVPTLRSTAPFSLLQAFESELVTDMAEYGIEADNFDSAATMGWAFAGEEVVSVLMAGAKTLDTGCDGWVDTYVTVGFEVDEGWRSVAEDFPLTGVLTREGEVRALVSGATRSVDVLIRLDKYEFVDAMREVFWFENAECVEPWTPVSFEPECAP